MVETLICRKGVPLPFSFPPLNRTLVRALSWGLITVFFFWPDVVPAGVSNRLSPPRSHLGGSGNSPVFLGCFGQLGGAFDYDGGQRGGGGFILFRPGAAADFLPALYNWNTALLVQGEYQPVGTDQSLLSADLVARKYFQNMRQTGNQTTSFHSTFVGLGVGASRAMLPPGAGATRQKYWSWLVEMGGEWSLGRRYVIWLKGQYRHYDHGGFNYSGAAIQVGAGLPLPW